MSAGKILLIVLGLLIAGVVITALAGVGIYNRLVGLQQSTDAAWAQVQNVYQRRADLIPNLVNTVSGAANFERTTLNEVVEARASVGRVQLPAGAAPTDPQQLAQFEQAQARLGGALSRLLVASEKYPELKANESFKNLQVQLEGTENRILRAREEYNKAAADYNASLMKIRGQAVNKLTGKPFKPREYYKADAAATGAAPKVSF